MPRVATCRPRGLPNVLICERLTARSNAGKRGRRNSVSPLRRIHSWTGCQEFETMDGHPSLSDPIEAVRPEPGFPIVGIGASAGGLAAFEAFFSGMPSGADPGMAFVLVQHLAPDHKSIPHRPGQTLYPDAGLRSGRRHGGQTQLRLHHPAQPRHGLSGRHAPVAGTGRSARPPTGRSISSSALWHRTCMSGRSASCSPALAATAHRGCERSRARVAW